ncbi:hypothetical protein CspHIS471_0508460 [Cutaneotrichosporon sp. HIS471]|nr:hypothetical protein CspHIS471_0508460 [Cutaneotrichosporon sp. HIS471]
MTSQAQLLPSLYALLPADQLELMLARLSNAAINVEPYHIRDGVYSNMHPVIPGQHRTLRLRGRKRRRRRTRGTPRWAGGLEEQVVDRWEYSLAWMSPPLQGREYADMRVQACIALEVAGLSTRDEIEEYIEGLGFEHVHSSTRIGHLFSLPIAGYTTTLHLTVTRVLGDDATPAKTSEPYFVKLTPARPVSTTAERGLLTLQDAMRVMQEAAGRIEGLKWETGQERAIAQTRR